MAEDFRARIVESRVIYLDYQATTPVAPEVAAAMQPWIADKFANPHSPSRWGSEAAAAIEVARKQVARAIGLEGGSLAFTGSATEALNWALKGAMEKAVPGRNRIVTVATEHAAVLDTCEWLEGRGYDVVRLPVGSDGLIDLDDVKAVLDERVAIVSVMLVNNEIGVIQPVGEVASLAHDVGALMLCDAVQGLGRASALGPRRLVARLFGQFAAEVVAQVVAHAVHALPAAARPAAAGGHVVGRLRGPFVVTVHWLSSGVRLVDVHVHSTRER